MKGNCFFVLCLLAIALISVQVESKKNNATKSASNKISVQRADATGFVQMKTKLQGYKSRTSMRKIRETKKQALIQFKLNKKAEASKKMNEKKLKEKAKKNKKGKKSKKSRKSQSAQVERR